MARTLIGTIIAVDTVAVVISPRAICHPVQDIAPFEAVLECSGDVNDGHPEHRVGQPHVQRLGGYFQSPTECGLDRGEHLRDLDAGPPRCMAADVHPGPQPGGEIRVGGIWRGVRHREGGVGQAILVHGFRAPTR